MLPNQTLPRPRCRAGGGVCSQWGEKMPRGGGAAARDGGGHGDGERGGAGGAGESRPRARPGRGAAGDPRGLLLAGLGSPSLPLAPCDSPARRCVAVRPLRAR